METNRDFNTCNACGRPFPKAQPTCNYCDPCLQEYRYTAPACIRRKEPDCLAKAVIPSITVETVDGITNLANCFVHVTSINTTFYIDDKHRPMIVWAGPVEVENYNIETNELKLRSQICFNLNTETETGDFVYFDKHGVGHIIKEEV